MENLLLVCTKCRKQRGSEQERTELSTDEKRIADEMA